MLMAAHEMRVASPRIGRLGEQLKAPEREVLEDRAAAARRAR